MFSSQCEGETSGNIMKDEVTIDALIITVANVAREKTGGIMLRVPPKLYQVNPDAYRPLFVSLGPFHHEGLNGKAKCFEEVNINIEAMEAEKRVCTLSLLEWKDSPAANLEKCHEFLNDNSYKIWSCYAKRWTYLQYDFLT